MKIRMIIHVGFLKKKVSRITNSFSFLASRVNSIEEEYVIISTFRRGTRYANICGL